MAICQLSSDLLYSKTSLQSEEGLGTSENAGESPVSGSDGRVSQSVTLTAGPDTHARTERFAGRRPVGPAS